MLQPRLSALSIMSIESVSDVLDEIDFTDIVRNFASKKSWKMPLNVFESGVVLFEFVFDA